MINIIPFLVSMIPMFLIVIISTIVIYYVASFRKPDEVKE